MSKLSREQGEEPSPVRRNQLDWPKRCAIVAWATGAAMLLLFGGILSAILFALCGLMCWTVTSGPAAAVGQPTLTPRGRLVAASGLALVGLLLLPQFRSPATSADANSLTFTKTDAIDACKDGVMARASHPSTVEFPMLDYDFREYDDEESKLLMSAKARNGFNLLVEFDVQCDFKAGELSDVIMSEANARP